jgi:hypothetical protein
MLTYIRSDGPSRMAEMPNDELMRVIGYLRVFIPSWRFVSFTWSVEITR